MLESRDALRVESWIWSHMDASDGVYELKVALLHLCQLLCPPGMAFGRNDAFLSVAILHTMVDLSRPSPTCSDHLRA